MGKVKVELYIPEIFNLFIACSNKFNFIFKWHTETLKSLIVRLTCLPPVLYNYFNTTI